LAPILKRFPRPQFLSSANAALAGITALSLGLHLYRINNEGFANPYYAVAARSMMAGGANFFFAAFDPLGFIAIDKPPLALWIQTASAWIFGFRGWALILPQALAGSLSIPVLYAIVRRSLPAGAGLLAALLLALTPILVAASRSNVFDSLLLLVMLAASYACIRATENGSGGWLMVGAVCIGLGFNIKMLEAFVLLPAFFLLYVVGAPIAWRQKLAHLIGAALLIGVLSSAWPLMVDNTPAAQRPYVGGTTTNRVMELIISHNGLERLGGPFPSIQDNSSALSPNSETGITMETGRPGWIRLFQQPLGGQVSWLLPLAFFGLAALLLPPPADPSKNILNAGIFWGAWLVPAVLLFSFAGYFHRYYLVLLAPPIAALAAGGIYLLRDAAQRRITSPSPIRELRSWLLPLALALTASTQVWILKQQPSWNDFIFQQEASWNDRIAPIILLCASGSAFLFLILLLFRRGTRQQIDTLLGIGVCALLLGPCFWSITPILGKNDAWLPFAGPELLSPQQATDIRPLSRYLNTHYSGEAWHLAIFDGRNAAPLMLANDMPIMSLGGFNGEDPIVSPEKVAAWAQAGAVRYFLYPDRAESSAGIHAWLMRECVAVSANAWGGRISYTYASTWTLWDCRPPR
jgi:4-amino-4-deoxy-L-arabinose transferase-like glycosyltransferase